jgi:purine-binding chemotaxis protein CheW
MVELTSLPKAPEIVLEVVNLHERIVPVLSIRRQFGLREGETRLSDQLIVADTASRRIALVVDSVAGVIERSTEEITEAEKIVSGAECVEGIARLEQGMLFFHNLDHFLSQKEKSQLHHLLAYDDKYLLSRVEYILANQELRKTERLQVGVQLQFGGQAHFITAEKQQILDLLISTYEGAVQVNSSLRRSDGNSHLNVTSCTT